MPIHVICTAFPVPAQEVPPVRRSSKVLRRAFVLVVVLTVAAAALAAVAASPAHATPSRNTACTSCHTGAASGTVTATPSTSTPAPGASYTVAISIGLTASGTTGYHIAQTDAAGTATTWVAVYGGPASQTAWTATMTAPATAGTYYYKVWTAKGPDNSSGQAKSALYSITVPGPAVTAAITSLTPNHAQTGASVVIAGTNLGTSGTVRFGSATATHHRLERDQHHGRRARRSGYGRHHRHRHAHRRLGLQCRSLHRGRAAGADRRDHEPLARRAAPSGRRSPSPAATSAPPAPSPWAA